jgi:D-amino-acid dehydrogenase
MLPDLMPKVGAGKRPGVFYNTGHGHLGWTLAAATAETIAAVVAAKLPAWSGAACPFFRLVQYSDK